MTVFKWCLHDAYICREENVVFGYKIIKQIGNLDTCISIVFCIVMCLPYSYVPHSTLGMPAEHQSEQLFILDSLTLIIVENVYQLS